MPGRDRRRRGRGPGGGWPASVGGRSSRSWGAPIGVVGRSGASAAGATGGRPDEARPLRGRSSRGAIITARPIITARSTVIAPRPAVVAAARGRRAADRRGGVPGVAPHPVRRASGALGRGRSRGWLGGSGLDAAASRLGVAPPRADRGAATILAGSAPMPRTPRLPGVRISKSSSARSTANSSRARRSASSTDFPVNSL